MSERFDRRTMLKTTGGFLAGSTMLAGQVAGDEIKPLNVEVKQEVIKLRNEGVIPVRAAVSREIADPNEFPGLVYFGQFDQFIKDGPTLYLPEKSEEVLATPVKTVEVEGGSGDTFTNDMLYDTQDIEFSEASTGSEQLVLGFFPDGDGTTQHWDTDEVGIINGII